MTTIVTCHGHGASPDSFNYIKYHLEGFDVVDLSYDSAYGFESNLLVMSEKVSSISDKIIFLGHSLGGIYCAHLSLLFPEKTLGGITMSTPWGGSSPAMLLGVLWPMQVFQDIVPASAPIKCLQGRPLTGVWASLVTTKGQSRWMIGLNDGVVSRASMMARSDVEYIEVAASHLGVLLSYEAVEALFGLLVILNDEKF